MPRWLKFTLVGFAALVPLALVGLVVVVATADVKQHVMVAAAAVKGATGRDLRIGGKVELSIFPRLAIVAEDVSFANAPWGSRPAMAKAKRVEGSIALLPLLRREIEIVRLVLIEPDVLLETDSRGVGNWILRTTPQAPRTEGALDWELTTLLVERGTLAWRNGASRETSRLAVRRLQLAKPLFGNVNVVELEAAFRGQPFTAKGTLGTIRRLAARDGAWPVHVALTTDGAQATLDGIVDWRGKVPALAVEIKAEAKDTAGIAKLAGASLDLPTPIALAARLSAKDGEQLADSLQITLGRTSAAGRAALRTDGPRPRLSARLASKELDLSRPGAAPKPAAGGRVFSDAPFPLAALRRLDGDVEVAIDRLVLPSRLPLEAVRARAVLKGGRLEVQPLAATLGGGSIAGRILLDASKPGASMLALNLDGKGISAEKVAAALGHAGTVSGGNMDGSLQLTGPGESLHRFVGWGNGELLATLGPARASGAALDAGGGAVSSILDTANPFRRKDPYTEVKCAVVRLPVRDGVAISQRTIAYETTKVNMVVAGEINLRTEALDLAVRPTVKEGIGIGAGSLAELVRVGGTLAEPSVGIDKAGSARAALSVGGAFLTGGLSLLGELLYWKATADPHPCQTALAAPSGAKITANASPPGEAKSADEGFFGAVRRFFRQPRDDAEVGVR
jgi:hypothetical protein